MRYALPVLFLGIIGALLVAFPAPGKDARANSGGEAEVIFVVR